MTKYRNCFRQIWKFWKDKTEWRHIDPLGGKPFVSCKIQSMPQLKAEPASEKRSVQ